MTSQIDRLLKERQSNSLHERRTSTRQPFVRPVIVVAGRGSEQVPAFSKDMSQHGIGIISQQSWNPGSIATLRIHSLFGRDVEIRSELRWCESYGKGWYVTGWHFLEFPS